MPILPLSNTLAGINAEWVKYTQTSATANTHPTNNTEPDVVETVFNLTDRENNTLLRQTLNPKYHRKTSSCLYIFQQNLVSAYREVHKNKHSQISLSPQKANKNSTSLESFIDGIHELSSLFIEFEKLINNPPVGSPKDSLDVLLTKLTEFSTSLDASIKKLIKTPAFTTNKAFETQLENLRDKKIAPRIAVFKNSVEALKSKNPEPTPWEVADIFKMHKTGSLGLVSARCMLDVIKMGRKMAYAVNDDYLGEAIYVSHVVEGFSDAERHIRKKMFSLSGTDNAREAKIPAGMIAALTQPDEKFLPEDKTKTRRFYPQSYLSSNDNIAELEELAYLAHHGYANSTAQPLYPFLPKTTSFVDFFRQLPASSVGIYAISVIEFPLSIGAFLLSHIILTPMMFLGRIKNFVLSSIFTNYKPPEQGFPTEISLALANFFSKNSAVTSQKKLARNLYLENTKSKNTLSITDPSRQNEISRDDLTEQPNSFFAQIWNDYSPDKTASRVYKTLTPPYYFSPWEDFKHLFWSRQSSEMIYKQTMRNAQQLKDTIEGINQTLNTANPKTQAKTQESRFLAPTPCQTGDILSPVGIPKFLLESFLDGIDSSLRKSPLLTTGGALFSIAIPILGAFIPGTMGIALLQQISEKLGTLFSVQTNNHILTQRIAGSILQFSLSTSSAKIFLEKLHRESNGGKNHEQIIFALYLAAAIILIAQYLPVVPTRETDPLNGHAFEDPYADMFDILIKNMTAHDALTGGDLIAFAAALRFGSVAISKNSTTTTPTLIANPSQPAAPTGYLAVSSADMTVDPNLTKGDLSNTLSLLEHVSFNTLSDALRFYNHLAVLCHEYNAQKLPHEKINFEPLLEDFYNTHCYIPSFILTRIFYLFPFTIPLPITPVWRALKYFVGYVKNDESLKHQVRKSFNKDLVLMGQALGIIETLCNTGLRLTSYVTRGIIDLAAIPTAGAVGYFWGLGNKKTAYQFAVNTALCINKNIAFHRPSALGEKYWEPFWGSIRSFFSSAGAVAATSHDLPESIADTKKKMGMSTPTPVISITATVNPLFFKKKKNS